MLARWDPFSDLSRLTGDLNRLFEDTWRTPRRDGELAASAWTPPVDIHEDAESVVVSAELPGVRREDVDVRVENGVLTVRGERKLEHDDKRDNYYRVERSYGAFVRAFSLPTSVDPDKVQAEIREGVLHVKLPKRASAQPKRIEVRS